MRRSSGGTASLVGGAFALQGPDGRVVTDADMKGQPFLVYFGYTNCPDVCPTTLAQMSDVLAKLPGKPIRALFITIDPERDTAASLKDYLASFDPRIIGLSGDRAAIDKVEKAYRVYARKGPPENGGYGMDHSSIVYLMDAKGQVRRGVQPRAQAGGIGQGAGSLSLTRRAMTSGAERRTGAF